MIRIAGAADLATCLALRRVVFIEEQGVSEADERNWLSRTALGFLESSDPLPPGQTRASQDVIKQYEDAAEAIPSELLEGVQQEQPAKRSWFSRLTFGLFD